MFIRFFHLHRKHRKIIHISLGILASFIGVLWIFFSISGASAAVTPITTKDVTTLSQEQIDAEKTDLETKKSGLESQMTEQKDKMTANRTLQITVATKLDTNKELLNGWKELEKNYKKYDAAIDDIEIITTKITASNKDSDKTKKTELEAKKTSLAEALGENIAYIKERDSTLALTLETVTTALIAEKKALAEEAIQKGKDDLKNARKEKKTILKEQKNIKKVIKDATSYLSKLTNQATKLLKQATNTQSNSLGNNANTQGTGNQNANTQGTGNQNANTQGTGNQNANTQGTGNQNANTQGTGNQNANTQGTGNQNANTNNGESPSCSGILPENAIIIQGPGSTTSPWIHDASLTGPYRICSFRCNLNAAYDSLSNTCASTNQQPTILLPGTTLTNTNNSITPIRPVQNINNTINAPINTPINLSAHPNCSGNIPSNAILVKGQPSFGTRIWQYTSSTNTLSQDFCTYKCPVNTFYRSDSYGERCLMYPTTGS